MSWQSSVLRAPAADQVHDLDVAARTAPRPAGRCAGRPAPGCRGCSGPSRPGSAAASARCAAQASAIRAGMSPGGRKRGSSGVDHGREGRHLGRGGQQVGQVGGQAGGRPRALALLQQPQAHDVAQVADRAVDAELVGEVGRAAVLGEHRLLELHADQRPGAAGDVGEPVGRRRARRRRPRRCRATRPRSPAPARSSPVSASDVGAQLAEPVARLPQRREQVRGQPEPVDQRPRPTRRVRRVEQPGGGGVGDLRARPPRSASRRAGRGSAAACGPRPAAAVSRRRGQLEHRVERQVLQPGDPVQLLGPDGGVHRRRPPSRAGRRGSAPGCRAARRRRRAGRSRPPSCRCRRRRAGPRSRPAARSPSRIPAYSAEHVPVQRARRPHRPVREPVHLVQVEPVRADPGGHHPAAGGAEVDGRAGSARRHRRKRRGDAAESTGTCRPVVRVRSPPVSANTASATWSGSTSRLSRVRWA